MLDLIVLTVMLFCGVQAIRADRLIIAAIWLAGVSALMAALMYSVGAHEVAVIELSVGAGLVTILFIFAISLADDAPQPIASVVPKPLAVVLVLGFGLLFLLAALPLSGASNAVPETSFVEVFWHVRSADALAQVALIFAGALSVLGFLAERRAKAQPLSIAVEETPVQEMQR